MWLEIFTNYTYGEPGVNMKKGTGSECELLVKHALFHIKDAYCPNIS